MTTINIDFVNTQPTPDAGWNNADADPTVLGTVIANLVDSEGQNTGLSLEITTAFTNRNTWAGASWPGDPQYGWAKEVWRDGWYTNGTGTIKISGFNVGETGTISIAGTSANEARDTDYNVTGGTVTRYNSSGDIANPSAPVQLDFEADSSGAIFIDTTVAVSFGYLTGLSLTLDFSIDNVDIDNIIYSGQTTVEINGSGLGDIDGVNLRDSTGTYVQAQNIGSVTDTKITLSGTLVRGNVPFTNANRIIEVELLEGAESKRTRVVTFNPASGFNAVEILNDTEDSRSLSSIFSGETIIDQDQWLVPDTTRAGVSLTVKEDGTFETGPNSPNPDHIDNVALWTAASGWTSTKSVRVEDSGG